jgi:hypothetical protein
LSGWLRIHGVRDRNPPRKRQRAERRSESAAFERRFVTGSSEEALAGQLVGSHTSVSQLNGTCARESATWLRSSSSPHRIQRCATGTLPVNVDVQGQALGLGHEGWASHSLRDEHRAAEQAPNANFVFAARRLHTAYPRLDPGLGWPVQISAILDVRRQSAQSLHVASRH